MQQTAA
jgi:hypothetical protein